MEWTQLTATFGGLDKDTLLLKKGLNLIYAPNERGKSTWCAFLRVMLYGLPTRDRKPTADKNRYAPWSGAAMAGRMDLLAEGRRLTVTRQATPRGTPMGAFSAVYADTAQPVEGMSGENCGELLTGVPREIYERSAFIRQAGLAIDQDPELERRIAALITSGEEDASYLEAERRLKKQLTRRRHNRTGLLPQLERELEELEARLRRSEALQAQLSAAEAALPDAEARRDQLAARAAAGRRTEDPQARQQYLQARDQMEAAQRHAQRCRAEVQNLPGRQELILLKSAAGSVLVNEKTLQSARQQVKLRRQEELEARTQLDAFPLFSGLTGQQAEARGQADQAAFLGWRKRRRLWRMGALLCPLLCGLLLALSAAAILPLPLWAGTLPLALLPIPLAMAARAGRRAKALLSAYGEEEGDFARCAGAYAQRWSAFETCRDSARDAQLRCDDLQANLDRSRQQVLQAAQTISPQAGDMPSAAAAFDAAMAAWNRLAEAQSQADSLRIRCETLSAALPPTPNAEAAERQQALEAELEKAGQAVDELRSRLSQAAGQLQLTGAPAQLRDALEELDCRRRTLQGEYDAIALALEALEQANAQLQSRFSPELGKKSAKYFAKLTGGKYNSVSLDRDLSAFAQAEGEALPRPFWQLSQGTADQLYLAVRLAICEMLLPPDKGAPLILDDALLTFDDERMAAALTVLAEIAQQRQILLFTCQSREERCLRRMDVPVNCLSL